MVIKQSEAERNLVYFHGVRSSEEVSDPVVFVLAGKKWETLNMINMFNTNSIPQRWTKWSLVSKTKVVSK